MELLFAVSQFLSAPIPPCARTSEALTATDGRRCNSGASYSRAAIVKVMAMLPPTMRAIAAQNSMKIRRNKLCISPSECVARTPDILDFGVLSRREIKLAPQIADVGIDAAVISDEF